MMMMGIYLNNRYMYISLKKKTTETAVLISEKHTAQWTLTFTCVIRTI